ncbi:MAG: hypothetical protein JXA95_05415 [Spirochaetales bacterium]|nr:hypothetical protein [Spirochaetales bacterium]
MKYRFSKNFMIGAGAASVYCQLKHFDYLAHDPSANPNSSADFYGDEFNISGTGTSTFLNLYGVINPVRRLNLFVSLGPEWLFIPFDGRFEPSYGDGFGVNEYGPSVYAETIL